MDRGSARRCSGGGRSERTGSRSYSIGIPKDSVVKYEAALKTDQFLLIFHGTAAEVAKAKDIIETTHPAQFSLHSGEAVAAAKV